MSTNKKNINLLLIGNKKWYKEFIPFLTDLDSNYTIEYISNIELANARLWHNSYDILVLEESFSKKHTIELSKMSYAMSRPTIIICNNSLKLFLYFIWKHFSDFTSRFITSKKLIYFILK